MDFLDPQKQKAHARRLNIGYALIGLALVMATTILVYWAYGFSVDKTGQVIQNGLVFVSSRPSKADIFIDNHKYKDQTNTRVLLPAGQYVLEVKRSGYRDWKRALTVEGGVVERFDYPFLFPSKLNTKVTRQYVAAPGFASPSPDRRWLLLSGVGSADNFDLYDLNVKIPQPESFTMPSDVLAAGSATTAWQAIDWAADNRHVLLKRSYQKNGQPGAEYILLDRQDTTLSQNLTILFGFTPTKLEFRGRANDRFYAYDQNSFQLFTVEIKQPTPQPYISQVLAFDADNNNILYVTDALAPVGKVLVQVRQGDDQPYTIRRLSSGTNYLVAISNYSGDMHTAAGAEAEGRVYVYKDPIGQIKRDSEAVPVPEQLLKLASPKFIAFSHGSRFIMAENGDRFASYDIENKKVYAYQIAAPLDQADSHATWVDGFHLSVNSGGKTAVFDFDGANWQLLAPTAVNFAPFFDKDYHYIYNLTAQNKLTSTALLTPKDL